MSFSINDKVIVILKEQCHFDPWDISREVKLLTKEAMQKELLGIEDPEGWANSYKLEKYMEKGIIAIKCFAGKYVGDRSDKIKVKPLYGLQSPTSEYFIIGEDQIQKIEKYETKNSEELIPQLR